jgi:hypothetical protein
MHPKNLRKTPRGSRKLALLSALLVTPILHAQTTAPADRAQQAQPAAEVQPPRPGPTLPAATTPGARESDRIVELSPFVVEAGNDIGYYSENTLAGSRLNSRVSDLAASITVVTRQQLEDTASVDINDIFLYEANTEGAGNYTPLIFNRGWVKDQIAGHSQDSGTANTASTANRVRGLAAADTSLNYYPTIARLPIDAYNTQSVEINRGPNSMLFGLGSPAGIVNQTTATANMNQRNARVSFRIDDRGGHRSSLSFNQGVLEDRLAIYGAALYEERKFDRKPSYDNTNRQYAAFTLKPLERTTVRGNIENYSNRNRRPNTLTPRDGITPWLQAGRPAWNPITRTVTIQDTGVTKGPYRLAPNTSVFPGVPNNDTALTNPVNVASYVPGITFQDYGRPAFYIDQGDFFWAQRQATALTGVPIPTRTAGSAVQEIFERRTTQSALPLAPASMTTFSAPAITDKSLYDWDNINISSVNFGELSARTYNLELEQQFARNFFGQVGWFRQQLDSIENYTLGQQQAPTVFIDTNTHLTNGSVNPNFGRPFVDEIAPDTFTNPERNDNWRAMLAYTHDFADSAGWAQNFGRHRFLAFGSRQELLSERTRSRPSIVGGDPRYLPANAATNPYNLAGGGNIRRIYYVGDTDGRVTQSPGFFGNPGFGGPDRATIQTYNYTTGQWDEAPVEIATVLDHRGTGRNRRLINSVNFATQNYFLEEKVVTTFGWRRDDYRARSTTTGAIGTQGQPGYQPALVNADMYGSDGLIGADERTMLLNRWGPTERIAGETTTRGIVVKPLNWFQVHFNESSNFNPPPDRRTDLFGNNLGKPEGEGRDYGIGFNMLENKLVARLNWFETENRNDRAGTAGTLLTRTQRHDDVNFRAWASAVVRIRSGEDPNDPEFASANRPLTGAQEQQIAELMGLPYNYFAGMQVGATQSNFADGMEFQLIYNPLRNWNIKFTAGKQNTSFTDVAPQYDAWVNSRMPVWMAARAPDMPELTTFAGGRALSLREFWSGYGYNTDVVETSSFGWVNSEAFWNEVVVSQVVFAKALEGLQSQGQRKYRANLITNYQFLDGALRNFAVGGGLRWQDKAIIGYRGRDTTNDGVMNLADPNAPVFDSAQTNVDLWVSYNRPVWNNRVNMRVQLNVRDAFENGGLQAVAVNWDGNPYAYRIVDSRQIMLTTTFDF